MRDVQGAAINRFNQGDFGVRRCPYCGYLQSWMQAQWKHNWTLICGCLTGIPAVVLVAVLLGWPDGLHGWQHVWPAVGYVLLFVLAFLPSGALADTYLKPNRKWLEGNEKSVHPPLRPAVSVDPGYERKKKERVAYLDELSKREDRIVWRGLSLSRLFADMGLNWRKALRRKLSAIPLAIGLLLLAACLVFLIVLTVWVVIAY